MGVFFTAQQWQLLASTFDAFWLCTEGFSCYLLLESEDGPSQWISRSVLITSLLRCGFFALLCHIVMQITAEVEQVNPFRTHLKESRWPI